MSEVLRPAATSSADRAGTFRRLAANPGVRHLWYSQFVSGLGDWLVIGLLVPMVTALSGGSSFAVAGILIAKIIPSLLLSSVTGVLVDAFDRRRIMIVADLVRVALVLVLLFTDSLAAIYLVVLLMETASLFFTPARNALVPALVDEQDVTAANSFAYTTQQASMLVGLTASGTILAGFEWMMRGVIHADLPVLGYLVGWLSPALLGPRAGFFLDSLTFVFSVMMVVAIRVDTRPPERERPLSASSVGGDLLDSLRFLREHGELRALLTTIFLAVLGGGAIVPVGIDYASTLTWDVPFAPAEEWLGRVTYSPQTFLLVFLGIGMVIGAVFVNRIVRRVPVQLVFAGSVTVFGACVLLFAMSGSYWMAGLFIAIAGGCIANVSVSGNSYVVHTTTNELRGRVFTALESVIRVAMLLSLVVMAPLNDFAGGVVRRAVEHYDLVPERFVLTGPRVTLMLSALLVLAAAAYGFTRLEWRRAQDDIAAEEDV